MRNWHATQNFRICDTLQSFLGWRQWHLLQDATHITPSFQVTQISKVTKHPSEVHPGEQIDPGNIRTAKAKVNPGGARFERRGGVVESRRADAEDPNPLSLKAAKVYVVGRMGIALRGKVGNELPRSSPAAATFKTGCQDNLSRVHPFDPASAAEMSEE